MEVENLNAAADSSTNFPKVLSDNFIAGQPLDEVTIAQAVRLENACNPILRSSAR